MNCSIDIDTFVVLSKVGAKFVYLCCFDDEPDEIEFGIVTKSSMLKFEITWLVVKSTSGCLGLTWRDSHTYHDLPMGRWRSVHRQIDDDCGLKWLYTPLR